MPPRIVSAPAAAAVSLMISVVVAVVGISTAAAAAAAAATDVSPEKPAAAAASTPVIRRGADSLQQQSIRVSQHLLKRHCRVWPPCNHALEPLQRAVSLAIRLLHSGAPHAVFGQGGDASPQECLARRLHPGGDVRRKDTLGVERRRRRRAPNTRIRRVVTSVVVPTSVASSSSSSSSAVVIVVASVMMVVVVSSSLAPSSSPGVIAHVGRHRSLLKPRVV